MAKTTTEEHLLEAAAVIAPRMPLAAPRRRAAVQLGAAADGRLAHAAGRRGVQLEAHGPRRGRRQGHGAGRRRVQHDPAGAL